MNLDDGVNTGVSVRPRGLRVAPRTMALPITLAILIAIANSPVIFIDETWNQGSED